MVEKICFYLSDFIYVCLGIFSVYALLKVKSVNEFLESVFPSIVDVLSYFTFTRYFGLTKMFSFVICQILSYIMSWLATYFLKDEQIKFFRF